MNKKYFFLWLTIVTICIALFSSCKEPVTGVMLNKNELTLIPGETETLVATIQPANASNDKVSWTSNNPEVATVSDNGLVTAMDNGTATITVTSQEGNKTAECEVTVNYRSQWVGDWEFCTHSFFFKEDIGSYNDTTYYYLGKISLEDTTLPIKIQYAESASFYMDFYEDGKISAFPIGIRQHNGGFTGNSIIHIYLRFGGLGGGAVYTIDGIKKERR